MSRDDLEQRRAALPHVANFEENLYHCASCNYCVDAVWAEWGIDHVCTTLRHHSPAHGYSGKGYIAVARAWFEGASFDPDVLSERVYTCTTCGNCTEVCPIGMKPAQILMALRAELADRGLQSDFAVQARDNILREDNPAGAPHAMRDGWADGLPQDPNAETVFLPGCAAAFDLPVEARASLELLRAAGAVRLIADAPCCGAPLAALGYPREAAERAGALTARLAASGAAQVTVAGAECLASLSFCATLEPQLESVLSVLLAALRDGRLILTPRADNPPPERVGYLDSCHLSKKAHGLVPRNLAAQARDLFAGLGIAVVEPSASPRFQICCGAAGGMPQSKPEASRRMADARLSEYAEQGTEVVVTASPLCASHLLGSTHEGGPAVHGFCGFLLAHFEAEPGSGQGRGQA